MGRGSIPKVRDKHDRQRKKKARRKRAAAAVAKPAAKAKRSGS